MLPLHYTRVSASYKTIKIFNSTKERTIEFVAKAVLLCAYCFRKFVKSNIEVLTNETKFNNLKTFIKPLHKLTALLRHFTSLSFFTAFHPSLRGIRDNKLHNDGSQVSLCSACVQIMSRFGAQATGMDTVMQAL